jgi:hypothetical protein
VIALLASGDDLRVRDGLYLHGLFDEPIDIEHQASHSGTTTYCICEMEVWIAHWEKMNGLTVVSQRPKHNGMSRLDPCCNPPIIKIAQNIQIDAE